MGRTAQPGRAQLQQCITATRIAQVHAGNGQVEGNLLVGLQRQIGQVERLAFDEIAVLLLPVQPLRYYRDPLVAQKSLVPLEGLPPGCVLGGVAGNLVGDGIEREGLVGVQQDQHEVRHTFEAITSRRHSHRREPTTSGLV
jgi:hypothetical protein